MLDLGQRNKGIFQRILSYAGYFGIATCAILTLFVGGWIVFAVISGTRIDNLGEINDNQEKMLNKIYNRQIIADQKFENQIEELERLFNETRVLQTFENQIEELERLLNETRVLQTFENQIEELQRLFNETRVLQTFENQIEELQRLFNETRVLQTFENQIEELERLLNETRALQTFENDSISLEHQSFLVADPDCQAPTCQWGVNASGYCVNDLTVNMPDGTPCSSNCYWNSTACDGGECQSQFCKGNCENSACPQLNGLPTDWFSIPYCVSQIGGFTLPTFITPVYGCVYTISSNSIYNVLSGVPSFGVQCGATTQAICEQVIPDEYKDCMEVTHTCANDQGLFSLQDSHIFTGCQAHFKCTNFFPSV